MIQPVPRLLFGLLVLAGALFFAVGLSTSAEAARPTAGDSTRGKTKSTTTPTPTQAVSATPTQAPAAATPTRGPTTPTPTTSPITTGLTLTYEDLWTYAPYDCYHEDFWYTRSWQGSLQPGQSFTLPLPFCTFSQFPTGPGGSGFVMKSNGVGSFALKVVSPSGVVKQAHLISTISGSQNWQGCVVQPQYDPILKVGYGTVEPGLWTLTFTNIGTQLGSGLRLDVNVAQATSNWEQAYCPSQDWNFSL